MPIDVTPALPTGIGRRLGIGCVGAGFIMRDCHLVAYERAGFRVVGIASRRLEQAEEVAKARGVEQAFRSLDDLLANQEIEVIDIAVPPDQQADVVRRVLKEPRIRGILAQKPLGVNLAEARGIVAACEAAGVRLAVNQNMRFDHSIVACRQLLEAGELGEPVLATIDMRAIPHWMPWQERLGWVTLRIMSIHHLDTFRYWFGDPRRIFTSIRPDPRTPFPHEDGICLSILEYDSGLRAMTCDDVWAGPAKEGAASDLGVSWRVEGTRGIVRGRIGWPGYPERVPSTIDFTTTSGPDAGTWVQPRWDEAWFPDAFVGPMAELLRAIEEDREPTISGRDNLGTMALVEAAYRSAREHRAIELAEMESSTTE